MQLHISIHRDQNARGRAFVWQIRRIMPFESFNDSHIIADGRMSSWKGAAEQAVLQVEKMEKTK